MRYWPAVTYFVGKPSGGVANTALGSLALLSASLVPVVGRIVWLGYLAEVAEDLDRDIDNADYDDFTFNRFTKYLSRGVYPFLSGLLLGLAGAVLAALAVLAGVAAGVGTGEPVAGVAVGGALFLPVLFGTIALSLPVQLHSQLSRNLDFGDLFRFVRDFVGRVGWDLVGATLGCAALSTGLMVAGLLAFCVGVYPAAVIAAAAQEHVMVQLYHRYLDEGGTPVGVRRA